MTTNTNNGKRKRATRAEMIERKRLELAKLEAQMEAAERGESYVPEGEAGILKLMRRALKTRRTALHRAEVEIKGRASTDKSPAKNSIDERIENARSRLESLIETKRRSEEIVSCVPFDIQELENMIERAETDGVDGITMPEGLYRFPDDPTVEQLEEAFADGLDSSEN